MSDKVFNCIGATNHSNKTREKDDFYSTPKIATEEIIKRIKFEGNILEPACGTGAISKILSKTLSNEIISKDKVYRGYGEQKDFFEETERYDNIITNPPFKYAKEFIEKALTIANKKVVMLSKIQLLEGQKRFELFEKYPPTYVYVFVSHLPYMRGDIEQKESSAMCLCWYVWEIGNIQEPIIRWIKKDNNVI